MITIQGLKETFQDKTLLDLALTHRSLTNDPTNGKVSNERLEFLGDAVLEYVVSTYLYTTFADKDEGFLTELRARLVSKTSLSQVADMLSLRDHIKLSTSEIAGGGRDNASILADAVEAIIGALYIDQGMESAKAFIQTILLDSVPERLKNPLKDPKSLLQEYMHATKKVTPRYKVVDEKGPDHAKEFTVEVMVDGEVLATGSGKSKSLAETDAAASALALVKTPHSG